MPDDSFIGRWLEPLTYGAVGILLWMVPVFDRLHVESAAVVTLTAYFVSGIAVVRRLSGSGLRRRSVPVTGRRWIRVVLGRIAWLLVPASLLTFSAVWAPNCDWVRGAGLFLLFTVPTIVFSAGLGAFLTVRVRRPKRWLVGIGVSLAVLGPLFDIGLHPQFYTYSTVFGGVLGPIYDEELVLRSGLFVHRALTVTWGVFFFVSRFRFTQWSLLLVLTLGGAYVFSGPLGLNTPTAYLRATFDGHVSTEHFDIHYDTASTDSLELVRIVEEHEFRYAQLDSALQVDVDGRIQTFIYPNAETRAHRTGARVTSVAPVWLRTPQIHVESSTFDRVFPHELVHIFSREFGLPVIRASVHVGLVEGLAVALEPPSGSPSPDEQVAAAAWAGARDTDDEFRVADRMEAALSPAGFWGGRGAVSYTTTGSFVGYLLEAFGPDRLKAAYPMGRFEAAYGARLEDLTNQWEARLRSIPVMSRNAGPRAQRRFSVPSLFERRCPHWVPPEVRTMRKAVSAAREGRRVEALRHLDQLPADIRRTGSIREFEANLIIDSDPEAGLRLLGDSLIVASSHAAELAGDALALSGRPMEARVRYADSISLESPDARTERVTRILRYTLAAYPEAVRMIRNIGTDSTAEIAHSVPAPSTEPLSVERKALLLADALIQYHSDQYENVLPRIMAMRTVEELLWPTGEAERFAVRLEAFSAYRTGRLALSSERARHVHRLYADAGDASMTLVMGDLMDRIEWKSSGH